jgi:hypothetical protein
MAMSSLRTKKCPSPRGRCPPRRVWSGRRGKRGVDGETKLVEQDGALRGVPRINLGPREASWMTPHTTTPPLGPWGKFWVVVVVVVERFRGRLSL